MWFSALLAIGCLVGSGTTVSSPARVVCYFTNWGIYRNPLAQFSAQNIPPHLCTHLHYAFGTFDDNQRLGPSDGNADFSRSGYEQFAQLKRSNPSLTNVLSLGGGKSIQDRFEDMASDPEKMSKFVRNSIDYLREHGFDGLEVDWQAPSSPINHASLVEALSTAFNMENRRRRSVNRRLSLSVTLPADLNKLQNDFLVKRVAKAADYVVSLQYRYHSPTANFTGHHAPLLTVQGADPDLNMQSSQLMYRTLGVAADQLVLGVPGFGITFTLEDELQNGLGAPVSGPGDAGKLTKSAGTLAFYEICENVALNGWKAFRPNPEALGPYAVKGNQWVAFDDEVMMERKGRFIKERGLGGVAVWSLSQDDFRGFCTGTKFPLVEALKLGLYSDSQYATTTTPQPPTTPKFENRKIFTCPGDGNFPKVDDCTKFYFCQSGSAEELDCPGGELFDPLEVKCSAEAICIRKEAEMVTNFPATAMPNGPATQGPPPTPETPTASPTTIPTITTQSTIKRRTRRPSSGAQTSLPLVFPSDVQTPKTETVETPQVLPAGDTSSTEIVKKDESLSDAIRIIRLVRELGGISTIRDALRKRGTSSPFNRIPGQSSADTIMPLETPEGNPIRVQVIVEILPNF